MTIKDRNTDNEVEIFYNSATGSFTPEYYNNPNYHDLSIIVNFQKKQTNNMVFVEFSPDSSFASYFDNNDINEIEDSLQSILNFEKGKQSSSASTISYVSQHDYSKKTITAEFTGFDDDVYIAKADTNGIDANNKLFYLYGISTATTSKGAVFQPTNETATLDFSKDSAYYLSCTIWGASTLSPRTINASVQE